MNRLVLMVFAVVVLLSTFLGSGGASAQTDAASPVIATFATADGSTFRVVLERPDDIARAEAALTGDGYAGIPNGSLAYGDGGVNVGHNWHMVGTTLADITTEVCDGTASMVDADVTYWVEMVGRFCPWSATVTAIEPLNQPDDGLTLPPPPDSIEEVDEYTDLLEQETEAFIVLLVAELLTILADLEL